MSYLGQPTERTLAGLARAVVGRRKACLVLGIWLVAALLLAIALPSASSMESPNAADLPASAQSVAAGALQRTAFGGGTTTPGILVFYRRGGLRASDAARIAAYLKRLAEHPLPGEVGKPAYTGLGAQVLRALSRAGGSTLAVPLSFRTTADAAKLGDLLSGLATTTKDVFAADLLTRPAISELS